MIQNLKLFDQNPERIDFRNEVIRGLRSSPKRIPPKFFYDSSGSGLFEDITGLNEYYLTRSELSIIRDYSSRLSEIIGNDAMLVEFGGGNLSKARLFLDLASGISYYVAVDISRDFLYGCAEELSGDYPDVNVVAICADFMKKLEFPVLEHEGKTVGLFLGSSIGNFEPESAIRFVKGCSELLSSGDNLIIGVDNKKDPAIIEKAYNDSSGITARFNLNLLNRINSELGGNFDTSNFMHRAFYNRSLGRIEMHLVAREPAEYSIGAEKFSFRQGESIHTENSYKYSSEDFSRIASQGRFTIAETLQDPAKYYSLYVLEKE